MVAHSGLITVMLADTTAVLSAIDIVFGEVDR